MFHVSRDMITKTQQFRNLTYCSYCGEADYDCFFMEDVFFKTLIYDTILHHNIA